jgi:hypothetical protein
LDGTVRIEAENLKREEERRGLGDLLRTAADHGIHARSFLGMLQELRFSDDFLTLDQDPERRVNGPMIAD